MAKDLPSIEMLHRLLICDAEAGRLVWRARTPDLFEDGGHSAEHSCRKWNGKHAGTDAFTTIRKGYRSGGVMGRDFDAHRVIWAMAHGRWPTDRIDHINRDTLDNRIANLREVTASQNAQNMKLSAKNTSGFHGVRFTESNGKWRARINAGGATHHLGYFGTFDAAVQARQDAEVAFGFHPTHGRAL